MYRPSGKEVKARVARQEKGVGDPELKPGNCVDSRKR